MSQNEVIEKYNALYYAELYNALCYAELYNALYYAELQKKCTGLHLLSSRPIHRSLRRVDLL